MFEFFNTVFRSTFINHKKELTYVKVDYKPNTETLHLFFIPIIQGEYLGFRNKENRVR